MTTETIQKSIEKKKKKIEKLNRYIEKLKQDLETQDFQSYKINGKEIRVYKWESKPYKEFPMPKGFNFCEFQDFVDLYDNDKIELEPWKYYIVKHFSKKQQNKKYCLSRVCLSNDGDLYSYGVYLANSSDFGRVVVSK